ncbi:hypothetical protein [Xylophilus ampelinus]|uniref:Uncharacterized protein n=1 Tax=Xylophilus ampelinus TaxID=54067 RepID=A0A318SM97_9BURK|nr:hypothetical protein [Xylophilus ampelinus]MCS4509998.1 hypothetical protein [Xylophilus ampelinus]PYE78422.1 hypothetical protein DFQ15_10772 [Xylophilus ampelinus]
MTPLQSEIRRLYLPLSAQPESRAEALAPTASPFFGSDGRVRCMVMELARPPGWKLLGAVWQGVQAAMELPAPAIAVSGTDGLQLWFSLAEPVAVARAQAFLEGLRLRFLAEVARSRLRLLPDAAHPGRHAAPVPALQAPGGNWSAFVAYDLAPVFADTPWLDIPPNEDGQATLLRALTPMQPAAFDAATALLAAPSQATPAPERPTVPVPHGLRPSAADGPSEQDPRRFLLRVMGDATVALPLRIDAAKALLPFLPGDLGTPPPARG